jgi:chemotaxis protein histidine kinase CheA
MACKNCGSNSQIKIKDSFYCAGCGKKIEQETSISAATNAYEPNNNDLLSILGSLDDQAASINTPQVKSIGDITEEKPLVNNSQNDFPEMVSERDEKAYEFYAKNFMDANKINKEPIPMPSKGEDKEASPTLTKDMTVQTNEKTEVTAPDINQLEKKEEPSNRELIQEEQSPKPSTDEKNSAAINQDDTLENNKNITTHVALDDQLPVMEISEDSKEDEKESEQEETKSSKKKKNEKTKKHPTTGKFLKIFVLLFVVLFVGFLAIFAPKFINHYNYGQIPTYDINDSLKNASFRVNLPTSLPEGYRAKYGIASGNKYQAIYLYDPHYKNDYFNIVYTQEKTPLSKEELSDQIKANKEWTSEIDKESGIEFLYTSQKIEWINDDFHYTISANELPKHEFIKIAKSVKY